MAESVADLPPEEILAESRDAGDNPEEIAVETRRLLLDGLRRYRQRALTKAHSDYEVAVNAHARRRVALPSTMVAKRALLSHALTRRPEFAPVTAQWRDLESVPDSDIDGLLEQLGLLGALEGLLPGQ